MGSNNRFATDDSATDPFRERCGRQRHRRIQLLGGRFRFQSESDALINLVDLAYARLPQHVLNAPPLDFRIELRLMPRERQPAAKTTPPPVQLHSGAGFLCGVVDAENYAILYPVERRALIAISEDMLRCPYYPRYELIEFAVFTLAARAQGLVPLHAACVGQQGCGVLLLGASGAGKSTLALHGLLHGMDFLAEDAIFVEPNNMLATGIANFVHIRPETLDLIDRVATAPWIRRSPVIQRRSGVHKFEVDIRGSRRRIAKTPLKLIGAVLVSSEAAGKEDAILSSLPKMELVRRMASDQPYAAKQLGWGRFLRNLSQLPAFELRRGRTLQEGVRALKSIFE